jgi:mannose-6-phosphate isomerase-like protein (cupin superfamily)
MIVKRDTLEVIDFNGLKILDYTAERDTTSSFAVIQVPSGRCHPEAWSKRSDKYYYVNSGTLEFTIEGEKHVLVSGDFCIVPIGKQFSYRNTSGETAILHLIHTPDFDMESEVFPE